MSKIRIEFFHDVICSFCFPMSYRMRQLKAQFPELEIVHRSFALVKEVRDFDDMFGSRERAKAEVLGHWVHANQNDDYHRFNIDGMRKADFPFPESMLGLRACKAASKVAGEAGYWDVFDGLQEAFFMKSQNIGDMTIIEQVVKSTQVDFEEWKRYFEDPATLLAVEDDLMLARDYRITSVPTLIINGTKRISGAQGLDAIIAAVKNPDQPF